MSCERAGVASAPTDGHRPAELAACRRVDRPAPPDRSASLHDTDEAPEVIVPAGPRRADAPTTHSGVAVRMLTSGTTGTPKHIDVLYESLEVRGPQLAHDSWLRTTDLARRDDDQFIWIEGRADDVIIRGGFKVVPGHVTETLRHHPAVLDACVIGRPDDRLGQVPVAAVELRPGSTLTADELVAWSRERLSGYEVPVAVQIVDALPRTPTMKVSQHAVQKLFDGPAER